MTEYEIIEFLKKKAETQKQLSWECHIKAKQRVSDKKRKRDLELKKHHARSAAGYLRAAEAITMESVSRSLTPITVQLEPISEKHLGSFLFGESCDAEMAT